MLAQRAAWEGPRWTRAVEDQSAPIPEEIASELGGIICNLADGRSRNHLTDPHEMGEGEVSARCAVKTSLAAPDEG